MYDMRRVFILLSYLLLYSCFLYSQNVGIGTTTPTRAKFEVHGVSGAGATSAIFGGDGNGISFQRNWPTIGFNQFRDNVVGNGKYMGSGFAAIQYFDPGSGTMAIDMFLNGAGGALTNTGIRALTIDNNGNVGIRAAAANATFYVPRGTAGNDGAAIFGGTNYASYFNYLNTEYTYIRPGKDNGFVIINDVPGGKTVMGNGASKVGINSGNPAYSLEIRQADNTGLLFVNPLNGFHNWELKSEVYSAGVSDCLLLRYDAQPGIGTGWFRPTDGGYTAVSDRRLKKDIAVMEPILDKIMSLTPSRYHYIRDKSQTNCIGFIAQDLNTQFPELVDSIPVYDSTTRTNTDWYGINYSGLGVIAIKAIQEQQKLIVDLQKEIADLKRRLEFVEKK